MTTNPQCLEDHIADEQEICRFCGYDMEEHTQVIQGVRICPDQEEP